MNQGHQTTLEVQNPGQVWYKVLISKTLDDGNIYSEFVKRVAHLFPMEWEEDYLYLQGRKYVLES